jgi:hypothetical protein
VTETEFWGLPHFLLVYALVLVCGDSFTPITMENDTALYVNFITRGLKSRNLPLEDRTAALGF